MEAVNDPGDTVIVMNDLSEKLVDVACFHRFHDKSS